MAGAAIETTTWARRLLALVVDWVASSLVVVLLFGSERWGSDPYSGFYVLAAFVVEDAFLTALLGGSFGKLVTRLRVVRYDGDPRPLDLLRALLRAVLVALVIPPLVYRPDGRGLHDLATGSATVTLQTHRSMRGLP